LAEKPAYGQGEELDVGAAVGQAALEGLDDLPGATLAVEVDLVADGEQQIPRLARLSLIRRFVHAGIDWPRIWLLYAVLMASSQGFTPALKDENMVVHACHVTATFW
jgi:hypothetical protein